MNAEELRTKTKDFAIDIIRYVKTLPDTYEERIISGQLFRAATSVASNYRAACRSRSKQEFFSKLSIVVEEADESIFWLEILIESGIADNVNSHKLLNRSQELIRIFSSARKTVSNQLSKPKF